MLTENLGTCHVKERMRKQNFGQGYDVLKFDFSMLFRLCSPVSPEHTQCSLQFLIVQSEYMTLMFGSAEYKIDKRRMRQHARYDDAQLDCRNQQCLSGRVHSPYRQTLEI